MRSRVALFGLLGAPLTVAALLSVGGAAAVVFCFLGSGLLLAALFGEAGAAPAPEGAVGDAVGDEAEFTERDPSGADHEYGRTRSLPLGSVLFYYVAGLCLCSLASVVVFAVT